MPVSPTQQPYILSEIENQFLFSEEILPDAFDETAPAVAPKAIFLGGQSGSGKSGLSLALQRTFLETEQAVIINSDALREYHPAFPSLQKTDVDQASFLVNIDTVKWQQQLIAATVETKRNLILDGTLGGNPDPIRETMRMLRDAGYSLQLSVLAVPARLSRLGIYKRYEDQLALKGAGRWVGMANHDRLYEEILRTLALLESEKAVDHIQIFGRPTGLLNFPFLYDNRITKGDWEKPPTAVYSLVKGRNQRWIIDEQVAFREAGQSVSERMRQRGASLADVVAFLNYTDLIMEGNRVELMQWMEVFESHDKELPTLTHRPARPDDAQLYFDWANDPDTRRQSFNAEPISPETHVAWFTRKLADPNALLLVVENETGEAVGQVRFERTPVADMPDEIIIGVSVDVRQRGKGLASQLIKLGCAVCREQWGAVIIHAYIKPDNYASVWAFERAGFTLSGESRKFANPGRASPSQEMPALVYVLETSAVA